MTAAREVVWNWNKPQSEALLSDAPYVNLEGGVRSGKTTAANGKTQILTTTYPGIRCLLSRWSEDDTMAELAPKWRAFAQKCGLTLSWNAKEQYDEVIGTGSIVYLRGLRSSDSTSRYAALRGLDLGFFHIEQAEEVPADYWPELVGRLSQVGYPHQGWITPQPVNEDHWISRLFPEDNPNPEFQYVRANVYDNRVNVGDDYIAQLERAYPLGSAQRRTLLEGRRGLAIHGDAVYAGYFNRRLHVSETVTLEPHTPLIESWDFGHGHPCVSYWQFLSIGRLQCLGAVMGHNLYLEDFAPIAIQYRATWCPHPMELWSVGDPAGLDITNQGTETSKVRDILALHGISPVSQSHANRPEHRNQAIQTIGGYMRRLALDGQPAFQMHPRAVLVTQAGTKVTSFPADGFEAGYVWDSRALIGVAATVRRPKKDGYYDHFQNTAEYAVLAYAGQAQPTMADMKKSERAQVRRAQLDYDEDDRPARRGRRYVGGTAGRGGY